MSKHFAMVASTTLLMSGLAFAQEPPTRQPGSQQPPTSQEPRDRTRFDANTTGQESSDSILVTWLVVENENEVALARIAQQRATSPEVKQFAQKMIDDHGQMVQKLQQSLGTSAFGTDGSRDPATKHPHTRQDQPGRDPNTRDPNTNDPNRNDPNRNDPNRNDPNRNDPHRPGEVGKTGEAGRSGEMNRGTTDATGVRVNALGNLDHQRLIRDLGKKHLESSTKLLQEKQGAEFDRCYMGMMLGAHVKAEDTIEVFRTYASERLRPTLDEGLKTVQAHLQHAKDLAKRTELASADIRRDTRDETARGR